jgi:hypothetical protein
LRSDIFADPLAALFDVAVGAGAALRVGVGAVLIGEAHPGAAPAAMAPAIRRATRGDAHRRRIDRPAPAVYTTRVLASTKAGVSASRREVAMKTTRSTLHSGTSLRGS